VLGVVIKAIEDAGAAAGANGLNVSFDAQLMPTSKPLPLRSKAAGAGIGGEVERGAGNYGVNGTSTRYPLTCQLKAAAPLPVVDATNLIAESEYK
jgi:hypothetical protein